MNLKFFIFFILLLCEISHEFLVGSYISIKKNNIKNISITSMCNNNNFRKYRILKNKMNINSNIHPIEKGISSKCIPIPSVPFDKIFLNIFNIIHVFTTVKEDRVVVFLNNNEKYVYYAKDDKSKENIRQIIKIIPNHIKVLIISDVTNTFENSFHYLYCEKNKIIY